MRLKKRTYVLPPETLEDFERLVSPGGRSVVVATLLREWLEAQEQARLRRDIIEGCREMADVMLEIECEFQPLDEEVWRALDEQSPSRRRSARKTGSRRRVGASR